MTEGGTKDERFFYPRDWEKDIEEVKSQLKRTKTEVTELKKKATSWEKEARDVRKQYEKERKLKMEAVHQQRTVEREMRTLRRELECQLRERDEIILKRNAEISDLRKVIDGKIYELKRVSEQNLCLENKVSELARAVEEWQRKDYEMKQSNIRMT